MRIGFVALKGLRVWDADLLDVALKFPALANRARDIASLPSLGLLTLAGMTPQSYDPKWIEISDVDLDELPQDCDCVAITALAATEVEVIRLALRFREIGTKTIVGGLGATLNPQAFIGLADCVVVGEGEPVWNNLLEDLERNQLRQVYYASDFPPYSMEDSPVPAYHLLDRMANRRLPSKRKEVVPGPVIFARHRCDYRSSKPSPSIE